MKTLVYLKNESNEVCCEEPRLHIGQKFEKSEAELFMKSLNKNMKEGFRYTEVLLVERCDNFYNYRAKKNHIDSVMSEYGWTHEKGAN